MTTSSHPSQAHGAHAHSLLRSGLVILLCLLITGCATGQKAYQKGRYQDAVNQAVKRLKSDPENEKAIGVLQKAYPAAQRWHLENIDSATQSNNPHKWESVAGSYSQLNSLADAIRSAPAARRLFPNPTRYTHELDDATEKAAAARYQLGLELLATRDRLQARQAIDQFRRAQQWSPGYPNVSSKLEEANELATLKVIVNPSVGAGPGLDLAFFENQMHEFITTYRPNPYVRFYTADEARNVGITAPDHIVNLSFAPFPIGETRQRENQKSYQQRNVLIGQTQSNPPQDVYGTVKADVTTYHLTVAASAQLDLTVSDAHSGKVIRQRRLPGLSSWETSWATYRGDERAIPDSLKPLMQLQPQQPPPPQALFEHSAAILFEKASTEIRNLYRQIK